MNATRLAIGLCALGGICRLNQFLSFRSLWLDESMLAVNIVGRSFGELFEPLGESQVAPVLFLVVEKAATAILGNNEAALRILPFIAGVITPFLVWLVVKKMADERSALVATGITAVSPLLIYFSNEAKPYGIDAVVAVALALLTLRLLEDPDRTRAHIAVLGGGILAILFSLTSVFVLPACWVALATHGRFKTSRYGLRTVLLAVPLWAATFLLQYVAILRPSREDGFFSLFFRDRFLAFDNLGARWLEFAREAFIGAEASAAISSAGVIALACVLFLLAVTGITALYRERRFPQLVLLSGPIVLASLAGIARVYPVMPRLWVFSVPLWSALIGIGLVHLWQLMGRRRLQWAVALLVAALFVPATYDAVKSAANPYWKRTHIRPLIVGLRDSLAQNKEPILLTPHAVAQWAFYTTNWDNRPLPPTERDSLRTWYESSRCLTACALISRYSGLQYSEGGSYSGAIDEDWARNEISRLKGAGSRCGWLLMHLPLPGEPAALADAIRLANGEVVSVLEDRVHTNREAATRAFRVCFR